MVVPDGPRFGFPRPSALLPSPRLLRGRVGSGGFGRQRRRRSPDLFPPSRDTSIPPAEGRAFRARSLRSLALPWAPTLSRAAVPRLSPGPVGREPAPARGRDAAAGEGKADRCGERPRAVSQGAPPRCGRCQPRGDAKGLSRVATSSKANKLESKPRNTSTSWNSASRPHSCPRSPNTCKAELIRTDSIAFVSLLSQRGGRRGGDVPGKALGPSCPLFPLRRRGSR